MLWMQVLWFGAVIGAAEGQLWLAPLLLTGFAFWEFQPVRRVYGDFQLMLVAVLIGLILDTSWVKLGLSLPRARLFPIERLYGFYYFGRAWP